MNPKKKPRLNAEAAYENAHLVARDLLERIGELLQDMPASGNDNHPTRPARISNTVTSSRSTGD